MVADGGRSGGPWPAGMSSSLVVAAAQQVPLSPRPPRVGYLEGEIAAGGAQACSTLSPRPPRTLPRQPC